MQLVSFHLATEYKSPMGILEPAGESDAYIYIHKYYIYIWSLRWDCDTRVVVTRSDKTCTGKNKKNVRLLAGVCWGHVYSIDFPPEYNNWDRVEPLTLFGAPTVKQEANPKLRTVNARMETLRLLGRAGVCPRRNEKQFFGRWYWDFWCLKSCAQLVGTFSHYLQGFIYSNWCRISAINDRYVIQLEVGTTRFPDRMPKHFQTEAAGWNIIVHRFMLTCSLPLCQKLEGLLWSNR